MYVHWIGLYLSFHLSWILGPFELGIGPFELGIGPI